MLAAGGLYAGLYRTLVRSDAPGPGPAPGAGGRIRGGRPAGLSAGGGAPAARRVAASRLPFDDATQRGRRLRAADIAQRDLRDNAPGLRVRYTTAEGFTNEFVAALKAKGAEGFKALHFGLDVIANFIQGRRLLDSFGA